MKVALVAAVISAVLIAAAESLSCVQCSSWSESCVQQSATECPSDVHQSCLSSLANFSLGQFSGLYQDMSCWVQNCTEELSPFTVHVGDGEHFHFASQCCQDKPCENATDAVASAPGDGSSNTACPACVGLNTTSCSEKLYRCGGDQRCVHLEVEFINGTELQHLVVKGCSDISTSTCGFLSITNQTIGGMVFLHAECTDVAPIPTPSSASLTACFTSWALGSLLLLGLLL